MQKNWEIGLPFINFEHLIIDDPYFFIFPMKK